MTLSIIIVSYNTRCYLERCLKCIYQRPLPWDLEVIVVDNGSRDGSVDLVMKRFPEVSLIAHRENAGFARANNMGLAVATGKYLLLLNSDTEVQPNALERLVSFLEERKEAGIVTGRVVYPDFSDQGVARAFPTPANALFGRRSLLTKWFPNNRFARRYLLSRNHFSSQCFEVDWVSGACMMFRYKLLKEVGLLDERFWMYWEDADYCFRTKQKGWKVYCVPAAIVIHHEGKSSGGPRNRRLIIEFNRSAYRYYCKHHLFSWRRPLAALAACCFAVRTVVLLCANEARMQLRQRQAIYFK